MLIRPLEHAFDAAFGAAANPLKHLGALACLLLALLVATGVVLYAVLDTSAGGAWRSVHDLSREPGGAGSLLRGLHRYGADAFVLVTWLHLAREWLLGRYHAWRRYVWWTGLPLLALAYAAAIGGFWLNWDQLGQLSAVATAEWLDALPFLGSPLARNFLDGSVGDRLFSLFVFVHLGVPLLLLFGLWFHLQRTSQPDAWPARRLAWGTCATLLVLALVLPVQSQPPADLAQVPSAMRFDWLLLFLHPLAQATTEGVAWSLVLLAFGTLFALPLTRGPAPQRVAVVDPDHCNGCRRCLADCPFAAIEMVPHPRGRAGVQLAQVRADQCASCGLCAGACPSSTPFRGMRELHTGIDLPQRPVDALRRELQDALARLEGPRRYLVFGCACGADPAALAASDVATLTLPCTGQLPPAFVEYALRGGVDAVLVTGCREDACDFRLGQRWIAQRLAGQREPRLRAGVPHARVATAWADAGEPARLAQALAALRARWGSQPAREGSP